jgi:hypothetical protein
VKAAQTVSHVTTPVPTQWGQRATTGVVSPERKDVGDAACGDKVRVYRWREANRERYNDYMLELRKKLAEKALARTN